MAVSDEISTLSGRILCSIVLFSVFNRLRYNEKLIFSTYLLQSEKKNGRISLIPSY